MGKVDSKFMKNVKVITGQLQHNVVIVDVDDKKTEYKPESRKRRVAKLRDETHGSLLNVG